MCVPRPRLDAPLAFWDLEGRTRLKQYNVTYSTKLPNVPADSLCTVLLPSHSLTTQDSQPTSACDDELSCSCGVLVSCAPCSCAGILRARVYSARCWLMLPL